MDSSTLKAAVIRPSFYTDLGELGLRELRDLRHPLAEMFCGLAASATHFCSPSLRSVPLRRLMRCSS